LTINPIYLYKRSQFYKKKSSNEFENERVIFTWHRKGKKNETYESTLKLDHRDLPFPLSYLERYIPEIRRVSSREWLYTPTNEVMTLEGVFNKFSHRIPLPQKYPKIGWPEWFEECIGSAQVRFVRAQRLLVFSAENDESRFEDRRPSVSEAVSTYSTQLRDIIRKNLAKSTILSQSLDATFPQRLISHRSEDTMKKAELLERLQNIEKKRNFLINVGLLDPEKERIQIPEVDDENIRRVLSVYVNDVDQKLGIYDELAEKINLLVELVNSRFRYKEMQIDKETGFRFKTKQGVLLPANLSSGEQHELVLTYELLFQTSKNTLVLIDEPELSLHVGWQIRFLEDMQKVINLAQVDVLVATHSPQIINNRWDLTVKLGRLEG
jgi:ABC-type ATPase involved in cell division